MTNLTDYPIEKPVAIEYIDCNRLLSSLIHLHNMKAITPEEYRALYKQITSVDYENWLMAQESILHIISKL